MHEVHSELGWITPRREDTVVVPWGDVTLRGNWLALSDRVLFQNPELSRAIQPSSADVQLLQRQVRRARRNAFRAGRLRWEGRFAADRWLPLSGGAAFALMFIVMLTIQVRPDRPSALARLIKLAETDVNAFILAILTLLFGFCFLMLLPAGVCWLHRRELR